MLVLQRKKNQAVMIGKDIEFVITEIRGDSVKIGIKAPANVPVFRKEIYETIQKQNVAATTQAPEDLDDAVKALKKGKLDSTGPS